MKMPREVGPNYPCDGWGTLKQVLNKSRVMFDKALEKKALLGR